MRGAGRFVADAPEAGPGRRRLRALAARLCPHPRHRHRRRRARCSGVLAVVTGDDMDAAGVGSVTRHPPLAGRGGKKLVMPHRPALARERVMYVGETVAMVIAETALAAQDAAELVDRRLRAARCRSIGVSRAAKRRCAATLAGGAGQPRASTGRDRIPIPTPMRARSSASSRRAKHVARVTVDQPAAHPRHHGAARRHRELRSRERQLHAAGLLAERRRHARQHRLGIMNLPKERLRVITEDVGGAFGLKTGAYPEYIAQMVGAKLDQPPGALDVDALGGLPQRRPGARHRDRSRACARRQGPVPGAAHPPLRQHGRLYRLGRRQPADAQFRALLPRHVRHPQDRRRRALRLHQHGADLALSRRRPAGGELRARARDRRSRAHHRHRPRQAAAAQSDSGQGDPLQDRGRHHLRLRRVRGDRRQGAQARRCRRLQAAQAGIGQARQISRARHLLRAGACRRRAAGRRRAEVSGRRGADAGAQCAIDRPGPRHRVPARGRRTGSASRPRQITHRHGDSNNEIPGLASVASRSAITAGSAIVKTVDTMLAKGKTIAANVLEAAEADIAYQDGRFEVVGTDRRISLFELAAARQGDERARRDRRGPRHQGHRRDAADLSRTAAMSPRSRSIPTPATSPS